MGTTAMKRLGITFMVIGIVCYAVGIAVWFACIGTVITGNGEMIPILYFIFALCAFVGNIGYGAIPLLILAHIRNKRETKMREIQEKPFCPYCGTLRQANTKFCSQCGNKLM